MNLGERIRKRRKELGLSIDYVAAALEKDRSTVYRYESNDIEKMPTTVLLPLAKALRTTPAFLMGWSSSPTAASDNEPSTVPDIINKYNKLNAYGRQKADAYIADLLDNPKYTRSEAQSGGEGFYEVAALGGIENPQPPKEEFEIL